MRPTHILPARDWPADGSRAWTRGASLVSGESAICPREKPMQILAQWRSRAQAIIGRDSVSGIVALLGVNLRFTRTRSALAPSRVDGGGELVACKGPLFSASALAGIVRLMRLPDADFRSTRSWRTP